VDDAKAVKMNLRPKRNPTIPSLEIPQKARAWPSSKKVAKGKNNNGDHKTNHPKDSSFPKGITFVPHSPPRTTDLKAGIFLGYKSRKKQTRIAN